MGITKFIARRLAVRGAHTVHRLVVVFALTQALGDPVKAILGRDAPAGRGASRKQHELGLDRPLITQYWDWLTGLLTGDPGDVVHQRRARARRRRGPGLELAVPDGDRRRRVIPLSIVIGSYAAARRDKAFDCGKRREVGRILASMPEFVLGAAAARAVRDERLAHLPGRRCASDPASRRGRPHGARAAGHDPDARCHAVCESRDASVDDRGARERLRRDGPAEGPPRANRAVAPRPAQRPRADVAGHRAATSPTWPAA